MSQLLRDLVYAFRLLRKSPGFAAAAVLSLAIGIGANSAMFSFADAIILRPIPVPRGSELLAVSTTTKQVRYNELSWPEYEDYRDAAKTVRALAGYELKPFSLSVARDDVAQLVYGMAVSGNFFRALEVTPAIGREFTDREDAAVVSHAFWKERLSGDPGVLGRKVRLSGAEFTIVGVAPASFSGVDTYIQPALYVPYAAGANRGERGVAVLGRLAPGATTAGAQAEFSGIAARLAETYPATNANRGVIVENEMTTRWDRQKMEALLGMMLIGIAGLVLVIACANVANLMLARGAARSREIAIRLSIGAGRGRLFRQLLTESLLLSVLGGIAGLMVAYWVIRALGLITFPTDMPVAIGVRLDTRVLLFSLGATLLTGLLFGLLPAIRASRTDVVTALKTTIGGPARTRRVSLRDALVAGQVAVAVAVLSAAGLLINSFIGSQKLDVGFKTDGVLMMSFDPGLARLDRGQGEQFFAQLLERVRVLPAVESAALVRHVPLGFSGQSTPVMPDGYEAPRDQENVVVNSNVVSSDYFSTLSTPIVRGRAFDVRDRTGAAPRSVVINETMARRFWPKGDALGARIRLNSRTDDEAIVIGVARNAKYRSTFEQPRAHMYLAFAQNYQPRMTLLARTRSGTDPAGLVGAIRNEARQLHADVPVFDVRSFRHFYDERVLLAPRLLSQIAGSLGAVGLTLAAIGLSGVIAYTVTRRTREMGLRMALGAGRGQVARLVLKQGLAVSLAGVAAGLPLAFVLARLLSGLLVERTGPAGPVLVWVSVILVVVTALASWIPARRAARIDPMAALRWE